MRAVNDGAGGNLGSSSWTDSDVPTAEEIGAYRKAWKRQGFPDVQHAHAKEHEGLINDPTWQSTPEKVMWTQVLVEAMADVIKGRRRGINKRDRDWAVGAQAWFDGTGNDPYGFEWTCDILGLSVSYVRKKLAEGDCIARRGTRYTVVAHPHGNRRRVDKAKVD